MPKLNKHDGHLHALYTQLSDQYDVIYTNYPLFSKRNRLIGEIDILALDGDRVDVFEVKCSYRPAKAIKQLRKIKTLLSTQLKRGTIHTFFYCGASGALELVY